MSASPQKLVQTRGSAKTGDAEGELNDCKRLFSGPNVHLPSAEATDNSTTVTRTVQQKKSFTRYKHANKNTTTECEERNVLETTTSNTMSANRTQVDFKNPAPTNQSAQPVYETPMTKPVENSASSTLFRRVEHDRAKRLSGALQSSKKSVDSDLPVSKRLIYDEKACTDGVEVCTSNPEENRCNGSCIYRRLKLVAHVVRQNSKQNVLLEYLLKEFLKSSLCFAPNCDMVKLLHHVDETKKEHTTESEAGQGSEEAALGHVETLGTHPRKRARKSKSGK